MYIVTTIFDRASTDTPYYIDTDENLRSTFANFVNLHKDSLIYYVSSVDESPFRRTTYAVYEDKLSFFTFIDLLNETFPTFFADRDAYCARNNIQITRTEEIN